MDLPDELLILVLLLLPVKSLLRFKSVCKHWLSIIQSRQFVEQHCRLSETKSNSKLLCFRKDPTTETYVISALDRHTLEKLEDLEWPPFLEEEGVEDVEWPPYAEGFDGPETHLRRIEIFGPVNGIYCIFRRLIDKWVGTLTLWNPATKEYKHIHPQVFFPFAMHLLGLKDYSLMQFHQQKPESLNIGFGFDHTNNAYKVVVICQWSDFDSGYELHWHLRVYNHASDNWRTVYSLNCFDDPHPVFEHLNPPFPLLESDPAISHCLVNGVFHWACSMSAYNNNQDDGYNILTFDMTSESCRIMNGPPFSNIPYWSVWELKGTIGAISGNYLEYPSSEDVEIWMMMEYGVANSWAKLLKFREVNDWTPVGIHCDDRIFFGDQNGQLISSRIDDDYCVEEHGVYGMKDSTYDDIRGSLRISKYVESLTSLESA